MNLQYLNPWYIAQQQALEREQEGGEDVVNTLEERDNGQETE